MILFELCRYCMATVSVRYLIFTHKGRKREKVHTIELQRELFCNITEQLLSLSLTQNGKWIKYKLFFPCCTTN